MNFAINVAYNVQQRLWQIEPRNGWTDAEEYAAYEDILDKFRKEDGRICVSGDIRIGDIILMVDSDTRIPEDCLFYAAAEFHKAPDIAIIQHKSSVMHGVHNYSGTVLTYFTQLISTATTYAAAAGNMGPFLGY